LNSGVNERRGRGFFLSMVSILDILSGAVPLMLDVRQTGGSPNTDQERRMGIKHLRNTPLAESVVPCVKVATEPGGESARLLKRIPQLVP
jgi:hypothetical protein